MRRRREKQGKEYKAKTGASSWPVFLFFACLYLLSMGRGFYSSDGEVMFKTTAALIERGSMRLQPDPGLPQIVRGSEGRFYSKYDPGLPLLSVPFYWIGDEIGRINHAHRYRLASTAVLMLPALAGAATMILLGRIAEGLYTRRRALIVVLAAGLASPLWPYARMLFPEAILACALTGGVWCASNGRGRSGGWWMFAAGVCLGSGVLVRAAFAIYVLPMGILVVKQPLPPTLSPFLLRKTGEGLTLTRIGRSKQRPYKVIRQGTTFAAGMMPFVVGVLIHNAYRFGGPFETGYGGEGFSTALPVGVFGLLFSSGKSVLLYAPPLILAVLLWPRFRRVDPAMADFLAAAWIVALLFYGAWWAWCGGWCWGPRFLVPLIPISLLPLGTMPEGRNWRGAAWGLMGLGVVVQMLGLLTDITPLYATTNERRIHFVPRYSPVIEAARRVLQRQTEPLAIFHLKDTGLPPTWTSGGPLLLIVGLGIGAWGIAKNLIPGKR